MYFFYEEGVFQTALEMPLPSLNTYISFLRESASGKEL